MTDDLAKQGISKVTGAAAVIIIPLVGLIVGGVIFRSELGDFINFTQTVDRHDDEIADLQSLIAKLSQDVNTAKLQLIDLKDFQGDTTDQLVRMETVINDNATKHVEQIRRATIRIQEHGARDLRIRTNSQQLVTLRTDFDNHIEDHYRARIRELEENLRQSGGSNEG